LHHLPVSQSHRQGQLFSKHSPVVQAGQGIGAAELFEQAVLLGDSGVGAGQLGRSF
jgi:hypothetical protein